MQINNVAGQQRDSTRARNRGDLFRGLGGQALAAAGSHNTASTRDNVAAAKIVSQYDVTNITPQQFSEMLQKLGDTGSLSADDLRNLTQVRADLSQAGILPNEQVNLVDFYHDKVGDLRQSLSSGQTPAAQQATQQQTLTSMQSRLDWLQKFATMHAAPGATGINAVA